MRQIPGCFFVMFCILTNAHGEEPDSYAIAHKILKSNFITPEEVIVGFNKKIIYSTESLAILSSVPAIDDLKWLAENGFVLIPGPPKALSLLEIRELKPEIFFQNPHLDDVWYVRLNEIFASADKVKSGWIAIRKSPIADSVNKTWSEQVAILKNNERPPNAAEIAWLVSLYEVTRGERLYAKKPYARLASTDFRGSHIYAFEAYVPGSRGFFLSGYWDDVRGEVHAITSIWKQ